MKIGIQSEEAWIPACAGMTEFFALLVCQQEKRVVIPMKIGIQSEETWIPAYAGMTKFSRCWLRRYDAVHRSPKLTC
jgi:hypothetical protein